MSDHSGSSDRPSVPGEEAATGRSVGTNWRELAVAAVVIAILGGLVAWFQS